jgi:hypothetical protein
VSAPNQIIFDVTQADTSVKKWNAGDIRDLLAAGPDQTEDGWRCRVCGKETESRAAMGPHTAVHKRMIGDLPTHAKTAKAKKQAKKTPKPKSAGEQLKASLRPPLAETLIAVLDAYAGSSIPTAMYSDVHDWIVNTQHLIAAITGDES